MVTGGQLKNAGKNLKCIVYKDGLEKFSVHPVLVPTVYTFHSSPELQQSLRRQPVTEGERGVAEHLVLLLALADGRLVRGELGH